MGKVVHGMEVVRSIFSYGDKIDQGKLQPGWTGHKTYLEKFPKMDFIRSCTVVQPETEL